MANVLNILIKTTLKSPIHKAVTPAAITNIFQSQARKIYSHTTLGLDAYLEQRTRTKNHLENISEKFRLKMNEYTKEDSKNMIFTEDLKNMIHLANDDDVELVVKMMERFNDQNKQLRFGNFIFGPVVMRLFHHLNKPVEALNCFKSPKLQGFFDQLISYQLLLDLLYENKQYNEILDAFAIIKERQIEGAKYPRNIIVLTYAACYKLNTPESLKFALGLWGELKDVGHMPMRRATAFCAGLAVLQGQPETALEILSTAKNQNYTTIRNLKVASLASIGRLDDTFPMLKSVLEHDSAQIKHTFNPDVIEKVRENVEKNGSTEIKHEFQKLQEYFKANGHIADVTLDEQLCMNIVTPPFLGSKRPHQQTQRYNRYNQSDNRRFQKPVNPGLADMH